MRMVKCFVAATLSVGLLGGLSLYRAADDQPAHDIEEVMGLAHGKSKKKPVSLFMKVVKNEASKKEKETLLSLYQDLGKNTPPKGSPEEWKKRCDTLVAAAREVVEGKEGATQRLQQAANCKACHEEHKED
jgi:hypothetical protein